MVFMLAMPVSYLYNDIISKTFIINRFLLKCHYHIFLVLQKVALEMTMGFKGSTIKLLPKRTRTSK